MLVWGLSYFFGALMHLLLRSLVVQMEVWRFSGFSVGHDGQLLILLEYWCIFWRTPLLFGEGIDHLDGVGLASGEYWDFLNFCESF